MLATNYSIINEIEKYIQDLRKQAKKLDNKFNVNDPDGEGLYYQGVAEAKWVCASHLESILKKGVEQSEG